MSSQFNRSLILRRRKARRLNTPIRHLSNQRRIRNNNNKSTHLRRNTTMGTSTNNLHSNSSLNHTTRTPQLTSLSHRRINQTINHSTRHVRQTLRRLINRSHRHQSINRHLRITSRLKPSQLLNRFRTSILRRHRTTPNNNRIPNLIRISTSTKPITRNNTSHTRVNSINNRITLTSLRLRSIITTSISRLLNLNSVDHQVTTNRHPNSKRHTTRHATRRLHRQRTRTTTRTIPRHSLSHTTNSKINTRHIFSSQSHTISIITIVTHRHQTSVDISNRLSTFNTFTTVTRPTSQNTLTRPLKPIIRTSTSRSRQLHRRHNRQRSIPTSNKSVRRHHLSTISL